MIKKKKAFVGEFKKLLEDFIRHKRNFGYKYGIERDKLLKFSKYTLN